MTHTIRQQYVHVEVEETEADGLSLQRRLPALCLESLLPAFEQVFNRYTSSDRHLSIERLEIDAGAIPLARVEHELAEAAALVLERSLREMLSLGEASTSTESGKMRYKSDQQRIHEALVYFLKTGILPWAFRLPNGKNLEQVVLDSWQQVEESGLTPFAARDAVLQALDSAVARKRLVRQFSPRFLNIAIALVSPGSQEVMAALLEWLGHTLAAPVLAKDLERILWETFLADVAMGKPVTSAGLAREALRWFPAGQVPRPALEHFSAEHWPEATNKASADRLIRSEAIPPLPLPSENSPLAREEHPDSKQGIYVENAGLVLLHPFLPQFFSTLGIAGDDRLLQSDRALNLLHFLATGRTVAPEYELVVPKILCNVALGTPVESQLELTNREQEEAIVLLEAVIRHWQALRNTSPDGLRGAFLLRPGKVSLCDDGDWFLQVESRTHDILLDQLPWGLSMIKLPWMRQMLRVEWR